MTPETIETGDGTEQLNPSIDSQYGPHLLKAERAINEDTIYVHRKDLPDPSGRKGDTIRLPITERTVNRHTYFSVEGESHSNSASSKDHRDHVDFLAREGSSWTYYVPHVTNPYDRRGGSYLGTNVPGVEITTVYSRTDGGAMHESRHKRRLRVNREAVDHFDELYAIVYRIEEGGSSNGSYHRVTDEESVKLLPEGG